MILKSLSSLLLHSFIVVRVNKLSSIWKLRLLQLIRGWVKDDLLIWNYHLLWNLLHKELLRRKLLCKWLLIRNWALQILTTSYSNLSLIYIDIRNRIKIHQSLLFHLDLHLANCSLIHLRRKSHIELLTNILLH